MSKKGFIWRIFNRKKNMQQGNDPIEQYRLAAEKGDAEAQFQLGACYANGQGVEQNYTEAVKWYRLSAEQGDVGAQNNLGLCYEHGQGVEQDCTEAVKWYRLAAENESVVAQYNLGWCYENGRGVEQDYDEAIRWYKKAAQQGDNDAQYELNRIQKMQKSKNTWTLIVTDQENVIENAGELVVNLEKALIDVLMGREEFAILVPEDLIDGVGFIQTRQDDDNPGLLHVETGLDEKDDKGNDKIVCRDAIPMREVVRIFFEFFQNGKVDTNGWYDLW